MSIVRLYCKLGINPVVDIGQKKNDCRWLLAASSPITPITATKYLLSTANLLMLQMADRLQEDLFNMIVIQGIIDGLALFAAFDDAQIAQIAELVRYR